MRPEDFSMKSTLELKPAINIFDTFSEYAYAIKAVCDTMGVSQSDIIVFPYISSLDTDENGDHIEFVKKLPFLMHLPKEMSPDKGLSHINVISARGPDSSNYSSAPSFDAPCGLTEYRLKLPDGRKIRYMEWRGSREYYPISSWCYFIHKKDYLGFAKTILRIQNKTHSAVNVPILPAAMIKEIYENTISFLQRGHNKREQYKKHNIPYKRGLLLCGNPGCGKTLTCKWLRYLCVKNKLAYKIVTMETYQRARDRGNLKSLFKIPQGKPGIIFFDDMDQAVKSRESGNTDICNFLTALDGIETNEGVVYIFTTNYMKDLDSAFVRPGRIDVFMPFNKPNRQLRRIFIDKHFSDEVRNNVNLEELLDKTEEYSFAELEEIRKLLCLAFIDGKDLSVDKVFEVFDRHRKEFDQRSEFGFNQKIDEEDDKETEAYWEDEEFPADFN